MDHASLQSALPGIPNDILLYTIISVGAILFLFFVVLAFNIVILRTISRDLTSGPFYPHDMNKPSARAVQDTEPQVLKPRKHDLKKNSLGTKDADDT